MQQTCCSPSLGVGPTNHLMACMTALPLPLLFQECCCRDWSHYLDALHFRVLTPACLCHVAHLVACCHLSPAAHWPPEGHGLFSPNCVPPAGWSHTGCHRAYVLLMDAAVLILVVMHILSCWQLCMWPSLSHMETIASGWQELSRCAAYLACTSSWLCMAKTTPHNRQHTSSVLGSCFFGSKLLPPAVPRAFLPWLSGSNLPLGYELKPAPLLLVMGLACKCGASSRRISVGSGVHA